MTPSPFFRQAFCAAFPLLLFGSVSAGQASARTTPPTTQAEAASWAPDLTFLVDGGEDGPMEAGAWLPGPGDDGRAAPLIVISHGNGGGFRGHADTARALSRAGFVVAALTHPGDNYRDTSRSTQLMRRPPQLSRLIDHVLRVGISPDVTIDGGRVGAFGFSAGGFTVTATVGGVSDLDAIRTYCEAHVADFACSLIARQPVNVALWTPVAADRRIKAAVIAAPALGYAFTTESLQAIRIPVQLWQAQDDGILPSPDNVEPIRDRLAGPVEYRPARRRGPLRLSAALFARPRGGGAGDLHVDARL